jgi:hypothetical protein
MAAKQAQPHTLVTYGHAICQLYGHAGVPLAAVTREHVTGYLVALRTAGRSSATIDTYYRAIRRFYNWAERAEITGARARMPGRAAMRRSSGYSRSPACARRSCAASSWTMSTSSTTTSW